MVVVMVVMMVVVMVVVMVMRCDHVMLMVMI